MAAPKKIMEETPCVVPTLEEIDAEYGALAERRRALDRDRAKTQREESSLIADLKKNPPRRHMPEAVAALVGDVAEADDRPERLAALKVKRRDLEGAGEVLRNRLAERKGPVSAAVRAAVHDEFAGRVAKFCAALEAAHAARVDIDVLLDEFEAKDVDRGALANFRVHFLGDRHDGHVHRFIRQAKEAGYV